MYIYIPPWHFSFNILLTSFWRTVSFVIPCILQTSETFFQGRKKFKPLFLLVCLFSSAPSVVYAPCCPLSDSCQRLVLPHLCPASPPMTSPQRMRSGIPHRSLHDLPDLPRRLRSCPLCLSLSLSAPLEVPTLPSLFVLCTCSCRWLETLFPGYSLGSWPTSLRPLLNCL